MDDSPLETRRQLKTLHAGPGANPTGLTADKCIRCSKGLRCEAHPRLHVPFWEPHHLMDKKPEENAVVKSSPPRLVPAQPTKERHRRRKSHHKSKRDEREREKERSKPVFLYDSKPFVDFDQPPRQSPVRDALFGYHPPLPLSEVDSSTMLRSKNDNGKKEKKVKENRVDSAMQTEDVEEDMNEPLDHPSGPQFEVVLVELTQSCRVVQTPHQCLVAGDTKVPNPAKALTCDECERQFTTRNFLSTHIRLYHLVKPTMKRWKRRYRCFKCGEVFASASLARQHDNKKHAERYCGQCQRLFASNNKYKEHVNAVHRKAKKYPCEDCGRVFTLRHSLGRHKMTVHLAPRLFNCPFKGCPHPPYRCSKALNSHIYSEHAHCKPFECKQCGKKFVRPCDLKFHTEVHQVPVGVVPTFCKHCGAIFRMARTCQKHEEECLEIRATMSSSSNEGEAMPNTSIVEEKKGPKMIGEGSSTSIK